MNQPKIDARVYDFIARLEKLNPGDRATLKRCAGLGLSESRADALGLFYSLLPPNVPEVQHEMYFLAATLFPLADGSGKGDLGNSLRRCRSPKFSKGLDRRVISLLDADETQIAHRLRQAVHFIRSNRVRVNWPVLLNDLLIWNAPYRSVQRRWAQSYFAAEQPAVGQAQQPA